jgi:TRAP transporter TAXI family solute receptor
MAKAALTRRALLLGSAALPLAGAARGQAGAALTLGTAGQGSAFLAFGQAVKPVVERYAGLALALRETKGSNENAELVNAGEVQLGTLNMGPAFEAWNGTGVFAGRQLRSIRALAPMYETPFHTIALKASGIAGLKDLNRKRVGVGPAGGPIEVFFRGLAEFLSVKATLVNGTPSELAAKLLAGEIDALWYGSGIPSPPFVEIADKADSVVFGFRPDEVQAFRRLFPYFAPYEIPAGTYKGQTQGLSSMAVWNFVVAHAGLPAEAAYAVTKALLDHADEVRAAFPTAAAMTRANAVANTFLPFHPGAARYYRETAVPLPAALLDG